MSVQVRDESGIDRPCRVLVADDDVDTTTSLDALLNLLGCNVWTASDGAEAVAIAKAVRPDAILLDLAMPQLDGCSAARLIRAQPWGRSTLIVAVTGWTRPEDYDRTRAAGIDVHLLKPVEPHTLTGLLGCWRAAAAPFPNSAAGPNAGLERGARSIDRGVDDLGRLAGETLGGPMPSGPGESLVPAETDQREQCSRQGS